MARIIEIKITGYGNHQAVIDRIIELNAQLEEAERADTAKRIGALLSGALDYVPHLEKLEDRYSPPVKVTVEQVKESLTSLTQHERQEIYRMLNTVFQCRM